MIHTLTRNNLNNEPVGNKNPELFQSYEDYMLWSKYEDSCIEETQINKKYIDGFAKDLDNMGEKDFFSKYSNNNMVDDLRQLFELNAFCCDRCYSSFDTREALDIHRKDIHESKTSTVMPDPSSR
jgi:hypothetical protein